ASLGLEPYVGLDKGMFNPIKLGKFLPGPIGGASGSTEERYNLRSHCTPSDELERTASLAFGSKKNTLSHWVIIFHQCTDKLARFYLKRHCPLSVTIWRNASTTSFKLRNKCIILGSDKVSELALRQTTPFP